MSSPELTVASIEAADADLPAPVPLHVPRDGTPAPLVDHGGVRDLAARLRAAQQPGPVALDAERASGFRYSARAYLVQLRRADVGTALIDPIGTGSLEILDEPLAESEWVLHAATQDLPCLAELGLRPRTLFDTELAGRLAGFPRVGLGPLVERMLGLSLEKGHGAADWSVRPLPSAYLDYAALDVEVLLELRDAMSDELARQGKLEWAHQEFAALVDFAPAAPRNEPWRRTSGIHHVRDRRALAIIRELWHARDAYAQRRDIAPHRVLSDTAIVAAATLAPVSESALLAIPVFNGKGQRRQAARWWGAIDAARRLPEDALPAVKAEVAGPPPVPRWKVRNPQAAERLGKSREALTALSAEVTVPVENLVAPDLVRRLCWSGAESPGDVRDFLVQGGARPWQIELVAPVLATTTLL